MVSSQGSVGEIWVWATAAALALLILLTVGFFTIIIINGLSALWPKDLAQLVTRQGQVWIGEVHRRQPQRLQLKVGNRDLYGFDFKWFEVDDIISIDYPDDLYAIERSEYGNFYGRLANKSHNYASFLNEQHLRDKIGNLRAELDHLYDKLGEVNNLIDRLSPKDRQLHLDKIANYDQQIASYEQQLDRYRLPFVIADGRQELLPLATVIRFYQPNNMGVIAKTGHYLSKLIELLTDDPREANTEGGIFPAIFGTILLVFIMSITSFPFGVIAGIYLAVYARDGWLLRLVRIAVNNLAGIPSIVFGIFGLAFFVYGLGATIDQLFFSNRLPEPTFGTGGILWASLTLGLLTLPVVIVTTEEGLRTIPATFRDSSLALGATRWQTLYRVLLPMASPTILTGFILAMARAAGEVAPLMITGVVKLAPSLAIDSTFPFLHLDRKFMHLGFHIYDVSCQSPNIEAAKPMVYVTTLLLVAIVLVLTSSSIWLRARLRRRLSIGGF